MLSGAGVAIHSETSAAAVAEDMRAPPRVERARINRVSRTNQFVDLVYSILGLVGWAIIGVELRCLGDTPPHKQLLIPGVDRQRRVYSLVQYVVNRTERAADGKTAAKAGS